jgi:hypothetical protein
MKKLINLLKSKEFRESVLIAIFLIVIGLVLYRFIYELSYSL